jgi:hypothetical protein
MKASYIRMLTVVALLILLYKPVYKMVFRKILYVMMVESIKKQLMKKIVDEMKAKTA